MAVRGKDSRVGTQAHLGFLKPSEALLVILLTRPREGMILSVPANLEPNNLAQFQPNGPLKNDITSTPVFSQEPLIPLRKQSGGKPALEIIPTSLPECDAAAVSQADSKFQRTH